MSSVYEELAVSIGAVADEWPTDRSVLTMEPGTRGAFNEVASDVLQMAIARGSSRLTRFNRMTAEHGMGLITRYLFLVAAKTAFDGGDIEKYTAVARTRETTEQLFEIAKFDNNDALEAEEVAGLPKNPRVDVIRLIERDSVINAANAFRLFDLEDKLCGELRYRSEGGGCPVLKAGQLLPIYDHLTSITLKDPSLAAATIALGKNVTKTLQVSGQKTNKLKGDLSLVEEVIENIRRIDNDAGRENVV